MNDPHGITKENLLNAFPIALSSDPKLMALADSIAALLARQKNDIGRLSIYPQIGRLDEPLLDILARDFKVDWWDSDYTLEEKRRTLQSSWAVHRLLGTKAAVELAASSVYPETTVQEWFEYGGDPYHFRLHVDLPESMWTPERHKRLMERLQYYKNLRSHLDKVNYCVPPIPLENQNQLWFVHMSLRMRANNFGEISIVLNGSRSLNGTWALTRRFEKGAALQSVKVYTRVRMPAAGQAVPGSTLFYIGLQNRYGTRAGASYRAHAGKAGKLCYKAAGISAGVKNAWSMSGTVTETADRKLNGAFILNGAKNLSTGTTRSEI